MIISGAELYGYSIPFKTPVALKGATLDRREGVLIRLTNENGSEGWGETSPLPGFSPENLDEAIDQLRAMVSRPLNREISLPDPQTDISPITGSDECAASVRFGFEAAVLNLFASRGRPMPEQLGDRPREAVSLNGLLSGALEDVLADADAMRVAGYRAVKLKVGRGSVAEDVGAVHRVAEILGDGVSLRLDANRAWGFGEALEFAHGVSDVRIGYVEEPLAEPGSLPELARVWGLPVALDETLVGMEPGGLERHPYARAVVLKPTLLGLSSVLRFVGRAKGMGMAAVVSSAYESGVGIGALVALAATGGEPAGLDTYRALAEDVITEPLPLPAPVVDVQLVTEAARRVDVRRLEPIPL